MSSPQSAAGANSLPRDSYGFKVKKEYQKLHTKYAPLWEKEEEERRQRWSDFLESFQGGEKADLSGRDGDAEAALEAALLQLHDGATAKEELSWWRQLRTLVQAGIPMSLRGRLWKTFLQTRAERTPGTYEAYVSQALSPAQQDSSKVGEAIGSTDPAIPSGSSRASTLEDAVLGTSPPMTDAGPPNADQIPAYQGSAQDWTVQIEKDLHRTFPGHPVMDRSGRRSLRRILAAYACRNPAVGYCQGMNFVAGCLLLFMEEEDAFWCLTVIVEQLLLGYFSTTMVAPQVDQLVFQRLVDRQFPRLTAHLGGLGVDVASVSTQWFLCVFVNSLPLETCLRVWDIFVFERCSSVLFRVALALVDIYAQALIATVDSVDAFSLLQNMAPLSFDSSRLVDVAAIAYAHVDHAHMQSLRGAFEDSVAAQVQERIGRTRMQMAAQAENGSGGLAGICEGSLDVECARYLPRIQVASPRSRQDSSKLRYSWEGENAPLHIDSSRAAATAYKIASSPASGPDEARDGGGARAQGGSAAGEGSLGPSQAWLDDSRQWSTPDAASLDRQISDVLDKRKHSLLESASMAEEERTAVLQQLMSLVARLEEEMFQAEARRFEAENRAAALTEEAEALRGAIRRSSSSAAEKRTSLAVLRERHDGEAAVVEASGRRAARGAAALRSAEANRALRASLLSEKEELISGLRVDTGQASAKGGSRLLRKLGFTGSRRRTD